MRRVLLLLLATVTGIGCGAAEPQSVIIPRPVEISAAGGSFKVENLSIDWVPALEGEARYLYGKLAEAGYGVMGWPGCGTEEPHAGDVGKGNRICLRLDDRVSGPEGYSLKITQSQVDISGSDNAGVFYGIISLLQLIDAQAPALQCVEIEDRPRFAWRGFMLDEARHFFGREKVLQILDMMAYFKLNKFHWHLTDSEGWRVEVKGYPRLAEIGGQGMWSDMDSKVPQYYTQDQISEIVEYAAVRHIEVIPEIDMPGHANASNKAYPEYSGGVSEKHGEFTFNPGKESTYGYLTNILREIGDLFPSRYMHLGGDEVSYGIDSWERDPDTQALIEREGFSKLRDAENYFKERMADSVRSIGKLNIGWEELVEMGVDPETTIMCWRQNRPDVLKMAAAGGNPIILCPRLPCYFDFIQDGNHVWGRVWDRGYNTLERVYAFPDEGSYVDLADLKDANILGLQANLWTERVPSPERLDFMVWPRLCAFAEAGWSVSSRKDFEDFETRMDYGYSFFDRLGISYYDHRDPDSTPEIPGIERGVAVQAKPASFKD